MNHQAQTAQGAFSFDSRHQVIGEAQFFERAAEHEFSGVQHEGFIVGNQYLFGQVWDSIPQVDVRECRVAEHEDLIGEVKVDAGWLNVARRIGFDLDRPECDCFFD